MKKGKRGTHVQVETTETLNLSGYGGSFRTSKRTKQTIHKTAKRIASGINESNAIFANTLLGVRNEYIQFQNSYWLLKNNKITRWNCWGRSC